MRPAPTLSIVVTAITNPYFPELITIVISPFSGVILWSPTCTGALNLCEQLLLDRVHELGPEVPGVQHDLVIQRYVIKHLLSRA